MHALQRRSDTWLGVTLLLSATVHVAAFVCMVWLQQLQPDLGQLQTTYYVDVVNLPVAAPQAGSPLPEASPASEDEVAAAPQAGPQTPPATPFPSNAGGKAVPSEDHGFQERMAKLAAKAAEQRQAAALESLRRKIGGGKVGMPGAAGSQAGSDYTAYLHSRLKDAFRKTISYQSSAPFAVVRLTIDGDGRILRTRFERSNGDKLFESAVQRAISLAEQRIVPPPGRSTYEGTFVFKPQGVTQQ
jgi:colicin import membrane protein